MVSGVWWKFDVIYVVLVEGCCISGFWWKVVSVVVLGSCYICVVWTGRVVHLWFNGILWVCVFWWKVGVSVVPSRSLLNLCCIWYYIGVSVWCLLEF